MNTEALAGLKTSNHSYGLITGWTFNALILLVDDTAVYTVHGGQPKVHELELSRNPLGPLQGFGESYLPTLIPR